MCLVFCCYVPYPAYICNDNNNNTDRNIRNYNKLVKDRASINLM